MILKVKGCSLCHSPAVCVYNFPEFFTFKQVLFFILSTRESLILKINSVPAKKEKKKRKKKNHKIVFLVIIGFILDRFKALVNQTFAEHSPWICQASVLTSQINSRVIKLLTQVYWLYSCLWTTAAYLLPAGRQTQMLQATMLPDSKTIYM